MILLKAVKNTYPVKEVFQAMGFKWNRTDACWEALFPDRRAYYLFMADFLDPDKYDSNLHSTVEFKAFEVEEDDLKTKDEKATDALREKVKVSGVMDIQEISEGRRIGLRVIAPGGTKDFWYDDINITKMSLELDDFRHELRALQRIQNPEKKVLIKIQDITSFIIPLYEYLLSRAKKIKKRNKVYYEREVEIISKHLPPKLKPVDNNEIDSLRT